jgi:uncharacterized protein (DUF2267 family)
VRFLTSANGLMDAARGGPLRTQAAEVVEMLHEPDRLQVLLVTLPEETPVNELVETAFRLEDEVGVMLGPVVVNACYPPTAGVGSLWIADPSVLAQAAGEVALDAGEADALLGAAVFRASREAVQSEQIDRLSADMPLPQLRLPYLFSDDIGPEQVAELAEALGRAVDELDADELAAALGRAADELDVDELATALGRGAGELDADELATATSFLPVPTATGAPAMPVTDGRSGVSEASAPPVDEDGDPDEAVSS